MALIYFFVGILFVLNQYVLAWCLFLIPLLFRWRYVWMLWAALGGLVCIVHDWMISDRNMPEHAVTHHTVLAGYIASIPKITLDKTQFELVLVERDHQPARARILMSCYQSCPVFQVGEYWSFQAKLRQPVNFSNPGGFDYVERLIAKHIRWLGIVKGRPERLSSQNKRYPLLRWRLSLSQRLASHIPDQSVLAIVEALAIGLTTHIDDELWGLFRRTGTTHLMVISGAHIGLFSGMVYFFSKWIWSRSQALCLFLPAQKASSVVALLAAVFYTVASGFGVPAQRALVVVFFMLLKNLSPRLLSTWQVWRYAMFTVLIIEPHAVLTPGFYLSFFAVAILILSQRIVLTLNKKSSKKSVVRQLLIQGRSFLMTQLICLLGLMPLTLYWFSYGSVNGFLANMIAIPWVGQGLMPFSLLMLGSGYGWHIPGLSLMTTYGVHGLHQYLHWVDVFSGWNVHTFMDGPWVFVAEILLILLAFFTPIRSFYTLILVLSFILFCPKKDRLGEGEARIDLLDVGQGLSILIRTKHHQVMYDTGVKFYHGRDMGEMVILPYLAQLHLDYLDKVVISHPDLDHIGGLSSLSRAIKMGELLFGQPDKHHFGQSCHQYPDWAWDGVSFHFFPINRSFKRQNNMSCVLQIRTKTQQVLLTGDIEKEAEEYLVQQYADQLRSSVLIVPHHGSRTSSTDSFLEVVQPTYALVSYGFDNRYHFPHAQVVQRYQAKQIELLDTQTCGMLSVTLGHAKQHRPRCLRHVQG